MPFLTDLETRHLVNALHVAIREQRVYERSHGYTGDSLQVSVWVELRDKLDPDAARMVADARQRVF